MEFCCWVTHTLDEGTAPLLADGVCWSEADGGIMRAGGGHGVLRANGCVFSRATPEAYGGSQARDLIGAVATNLCQEPRDPSRVYDLHHSSRQPLTHWARPGIEPPTSWFLVRIINHWAMRETPTANIYWKPTMESQRVSIPVKRHFHLVSCYYCYGCYCCCAI